MRFLKAEPDWVIYHLYIMSDDTVTNFCMNLFCTNWYIINSLVEWKYKIIKINHVGQKIFNLTNELMSYQFVQEFVTISLLLYYSLSPLMEACRNLEYCMIWAHLFQLFCVHFDWAHRSGFISKFTNKIHTQRNNSNEKTNYEQS